jgi:hypothetical protein
MLRRRNELRTDARNRVIGQAMPNAIAASNADVTSTRRYFFRVYVIFIAPICAPSAVVVVMSITK